MQDACILGGDRPAGYCWYVKENPKATVQTIAELRQALKEKKGQMAVLRGEQAKAATKLRKADSALNKAAAAKAKKKAEGK